MVAAAAHRLLYRGDPSVDRSMGYLPQCPWGLFLTTSIHLPNIQMGFIFTSFIQSINILCLPTDHSQGTYLYNYIYSSHKFLNLTTIIIHHRLYKSRFLLTLPVHNLFHPFFEDNSSLYKQFINNFCHCKTTNINFLFQCP
jgi:hypothetical protein